jgi:5-methylcytosine-specific restriction endonuclease McrA
MKRTPLPRGKTTLKKSGTLKRSNLKAKPKSAEEKQQQVEDIERMHKLFEEHWQLKKQKNLITGLNYWQCENCFTGIWGENKTLYHHHVLPKAKYPQYKYDIQNLVLLCQDCHSKTENGYPGEEVRKRTEQVKQKYGL